MALGAMLGLVGGCTMYVGDGDDNLGVSGGGTDSGGDQAVNLDGSWSIDRALVSATPVPPRTAACSEGFTTGYQPSKLTISGMLVGTDYGSTLTNVTFGGGHDLSFDALEYWNTVGWNSQHTIHYELDQDSADTLRGVVTATPPWPNGACAYKYIIASQRQN